MKELSIEEKAKRYDKVLERARYVYTYYCDDREQLRKIESIFPELKESGNIRIIKAIKYGLDHVFTNNTTVFEVTKEQCLAWLEKQDEQKPAWSEGDESIALGIEQLCNCADLLMIAPDKIDKIRNWLKSLKERIQPKQEWSEEDEMMLFSVIWHLRDSVNKGDQSSPAGKLEPWIRTLKDRVLPQPKQEWSEEDKEMIEALNTYVKQLDVMFSEIKIGDKDILAKDFRENVQNWLKSLRPQSQWRPSDEQMNGLKEAIEFLGCTKTSREPL